MPYDKIYYARIREERKQKGLCLRCGKQPPREGVTTCGDCAAAFKKTYNKMKSKGLCVVCCTNPRISGRTQCESCRHVQRKRTQRKGFCVKCGKKNETELKHCPDCLARIRNRNEKKRRRVLDHYGNTCACCGETIYEFLQIDHINNDGAEHRRKIGKGIYTWLIKNKFPAGFQILCANCNIAKAHYGRCPHTPNTEVESAQDNQTSSG